MTIHEFGWRMPRVETTEDAVSFAWLEDDGHEAAFKISAADWRDMGSPDLLWVSARRVEHDEPKEES